MAIADYKFNGRLERPHEMALEAIHGSVTAGDAVVVGVYGPQQALWEVLRDMGHESGHLAHECAVFEGEENGRPWKVLVGPIDCVGAVDVDDDDDECEGHPAGPYDPMGETVYCDGSCRS